MDDANIARELLPLEEGTEWLTAAFLVVILVELAWDVARRRRRDVRETAANLAVGIGQDVLGKLVGTPIALFFLGLAWNVAPVRMPVTWWSWAIGFVLSDLVYYWTHRLEHRSRLFWTHHGVHHSSTSFDFSTAGRIAWTEPLVSWYGLVPLTLLGFHPLQVLILSTLGLLYQTWIHTEHIGDLGAFERVFNSPAAHRVHHASNATYLDANYGAVLIVWDRLFGTYVRATPDEPVRYGLTTDIGTKNPIRINLHGYAELLRGLRLTRSWGERLLWTLGPPEWSVTRGFESTRPSSLWLRARARARGARAAA